MNSQFYATRRRWCLVGLMTNCYFSADDFSSRHTRVSHRRDKESIVWLAFDEEKVVQVKSSFSHQKDQTKDIIKSKVQSYWSWYHLSFPDDWTNLFFPSKKSFFRTMLGALEANCSISLRLTLIFVLWTIHAQAMVTRSLSYSFLTGAFPVLPYPSPSELATKNHVLSKIYIYRWFLMRQSFSDCPERDNDRLSRDLPLEHDIAGDDWNALRPRVEVFGSPLADQSPNGWCSLCLVPHTQCSGWVTTRLA